MTQRRLDAPFALAATAFFVSGACALVYQVVWQRILALGSGAGIYSVATIVAAFMAGLGIGSHLGGGLSARLRPSRALVAFALVEVGIGAFGALSPTLFYDLLYRKASFLYAGPWSSVATHFASLIVPTTLMGLSLPLLVRALVRTSAGASRRVTIVYGINVLGAATGAAAGPWLLMRHLGLDGALYAAAAGNLLAAGAALLAWRTTKDETPVPPVEAPVHGEAHLPFGAWALLYGVTGFVALGLEILWFRVMSVAVKSTSFTFGTVLALYLVGAGAGSLVGAGWSHRVTRPLRSFLTLQFALVVFAALGFVALTALPADGALLSFFTQYWSGEISQLRLGAADDVAGLVRLYVVLPLALFGVPTFLMGASFPVLQRAVHDDPEASSRRVGLLQAANIAGCTAGSLVVGLVGLDRLGTAGTLRFLIGCGVLVTLVGVLREGWRSRFALFAVGLAALAVLVPGQERLWRRLHGVTDPKAQTLLAEDASGVGMIAPGGPGWAVTIDGLYHSWLPFGGVHTNLGALGALVHPHPRRVAIIGLASGDTPWALGLRPETEALTVFEIFRSQERLLHEAAVRIPDARLDPLRSFLADPRVRIVAADGRHALARSTETFDVIESDALWPEASFAGNLYSREFFALVRSRLAPGGVFVVWAPLKRVRRTLRATFPEVICVEQGVCLASVETVALDVEAWRARLEWPQVRTYLAHPDRVEGVRHMLGTANRLTGSPKSDFNEDLFPRDELLLPAQTEH